MSTCVNTHKCSEAVPFLVKQFQSGSWPSRLLDVETYSDDVRLVEMKDPTMVYAALSYCWGTNTNVHANYITTKDTLDASFKRIVYASLPRTLQDAITICRGLGIGYLWIDALCIIQDSPQDWQTEAVKMGIIYSQAVVTIAASLGDNCDSGCFNKRTNALEPQIPSDTVEVSSILTTGEVSNLCFYRDWRKEDFSFQHTAEIASSPLQTRGWTLQERILATRILHYGSNMLCWECRYCYADEQYLRSRYGKDDTIPSFTINHLEAHLGHRSLERQIITQWYRNIVEEYSRRALTYQTDKLPAISAVARLIHDHTGATYIAGLWTLNLQYGLFWKSVGPKVQHPVYVAPSFSWASCSNPVQWNEDPSVHMDEAEFTITGFGFEYEGNDLFGKLRSGWLGLKGHLLRAKVQPYNMPFHEFKRLAYRVNLREEDIVLPNALLFAETGEKCGHAYLDVVNPDEEVMCFLLKKSSGSDPLCSLVISPDSANGSRYERRGVAGLANNPWEDVFQASPAVDFIIG